MKYYLCGAFWNKECKDFFDDFIEKIQKTKMSSGSLDIDTSIEPNVMSLDQVFVPGHFNVDFNEIKKSWSPSNMRRVLKQVLDLDINNIEEGLVMYAKIPDLGSLFELGYYLAKNTYPESIYGSYNNMKKNLIIEGGYDKLYSSIDRAIKFREIKKYNPELNIPCPLIIGGIIQISMCYADGFNVAVIRTDNIEEDPFSSIMAGYMYYLGVPFITYSSKDTRSNTMMLAASLGHMRLKSNKIEKIKRSAIDHLNNINNNFWSDENINCSKGID